MSSSLDIRTNVEETEETALSKLNIQLKIAATVASMQMAINVRLVNERQE